MQVAAGATAGMTSSATRNGGTLPDADVIASASRSMAIAREALVDVEAQVAGGALGGALAEAVRLIRDRAGRLIVTGVGKSGHIARKLAATFASTGTPAYYLHPTEATHGDLGMVDPSDVVLALSWSGETSELAQTIHYTKRFAVPLISITADAHSTLARESTVALVLPRVREACPHNLAPTTSTLLQLALGDAIAVALIDVRGFSAAEFKIYHPGGRLGARLLSVAELMRRAPDLPLARPGTAMAEAIGIISAYTYGAVGIVDQDERLVGVITDGDLRRHMAPDLLERTVEDVMTRNPVCVSPDMLAGEALKILEARQIGALFVVAEGKPVGMLRTVDLLRAGVA